MVEAVAATSLPTDEVAPPEVVAELLDLLAARPTYWRTLVHAVLQAPEAAVPGTASTTELFAGLWRGQDPDRAASSAVAGMTALGWLLFGEYWRTRPGPTPPTSGGWWPSRSRARSAPTVPDRPRPPEGRSRDQLSRSSLALPLAHDLQAGDAGQPEAVAGVVGPAGQGVPERGVGGPRQRLVADVPALAEGDPDRRPLRGVVPDASSGHQHPASHLEGQPRTVAAHRRRRHPPHPEVLRDQLELELGQRDGVDQHGRHVLVG